MRTMFVKDQEQPMLCLAVRNALKSMLRGYGFICSGVSESHYNW